MPDDTSNLVGVTHPDHGACATGGREAGGMTLAGLISSTNVTGGALADHVDRLAANDRLTECLALPR